MSQYLYNQNTTNSFFHNFIIALLEFLNNKLYIEQTIDDVETKYSIPFFYNAAGDERFMQDIFQQTSFNQNLRTKITEANYDIIPRGHITINGISIQASSLTNRFVRGEYQIETETEIETHNAPINVIPLQISLQIEIKLDTLSMTLQMCEKVIETFYKSWAFEFLDKGMSIRASVGFPEENTIEHSYEFSFGDINDNKLTFNLEVETYMFVKDLTQDFKKSQRIEGFEMNYHYENINFRTDKKNIIPPDGYISKQSLEETVDYPGFSLSNNFGNNPYKDDISITHESNELKQLNKNNK